MTSSPSTSTALRLRDVEEYGNAEEADGDSDNDAAGGTDETSITMASSTLVPLLRSPM